MRFVWTPTAVLQSALLLIYLLVLRQVVRGTEIGAIAIAYVDAFAFWVLAAYAATIAFVDVYDEDELDEDEDVEP